MENEIMKVLILEDNSALRFALRQNIEKNGHDVFATGKIVHACKYLLTEQPDILLLDLMVDNVETVQVADLADFRAPHAHVIYITGSSRYPNGELFSMSRNTTWVLRKPIDFSELNAMLLHLSSSSSKKQMSGKQPMVDGKVAEPN
jgi:DNA-binding response OmpR family regulator